MAGGTAIITGGGALLGLAGSGTVSAAAILLQTPSEYWYRQSAKLLTYCKCILIDKFHDIKSVSIILKQITDAITNSEDRLKELKAEKNDLDKDLIKKTETYIKVLKKCERELSKILK